jgi:predicted DCC family thiol-disulfide oxidoreductase YuxK
MQHLNVLYDPACGLCVRVKHWLEHQPVYVPLFLIPGGSPMAQKLCPGLNETRTLNELVVISDSGGVYLDGRAWIMCLWALRDYRRWAYRLASPALLPVARQAFEVLSSRRGLVSKIFGMASELEMAEELRQVAVPVCAVPVCSDRWLS